MEKREDYEPFANAAQFADDCGTQLVGGQMMEKPETHCAIKTAVWETQLLRVAEHDARWRLNTGQFLPCQSEHGVRDVCRGHAQPRLESGKAVQIETSRKSRRVFLREMTPWRSSRRSAWR